MAHPRHVLGVSSIHSFLEGAARKGPADMMYVTILHVVRPSSTICLAETNADQLPPQSGRRGRKGTRC